MIIFKGKLNVTRNGERWKKGYVNVPVPEMERFGWKNTEVAVVMIRPGEKINGKKLIDELSHFKNILKLEEEVKKLKSDMICMTGLDQLKDDNLTQDQTE